MTDIDPYESHDLELRRVHAALLTMVRKLWEADLPPEELAEKARAACRAVLFHHDIEDKVLFPRLLAEARRRSMALAFLDACDREHRAIHDMCARLQVLTEASKIDREAIATLASEIHGRLAKHTEEEERGLAPASLQQMIDPEGLRDVARDAETLRQRLTSTSFIR